MVSGGCEGSQGIGARHHSLDQREYPNGTAGVRTAGSNVPHFAKIPPTAVSRFY